jgi:hypothetical protein
MKDYVTDLKHPLDEILRHGPSAFMGPLGLLAFSAPHRILRRKVALICISRISKLVDWRYRSIEVLPLTSQVELITSIYEALYGVQTDRDNALIAKLIPSIAQCLASVLRYERKRCHPEYRPLQCGSVVRRWHDRLRDKGYRRFEGVKCEEWYAADPA